MNKLIFLLLFVIVTMVSSCSSGPIITADQIEQQLKVMGFDMPSEDRQIGLRMLANGRYDTWIRNGSIIRPYGQPMKPQGSMFYQYNYTTTSASIGCSMAALIQQGGRFVFFVSEKGIKAMEELLQRLDAKLAFKFQQLIKLSATKRVKKESFKMTETIGNTDICVTNVGYFIASHSRPFWFIDRERILDHKGFPSELDQIIPN